VLITGESGTGKSELARCIHDASPRRDGPFVTLHCASVTETLIESELFGHEAGSFTGAVGQRVGRFEQADGGTLFIDEVAEIAPNIQTKLLSVLQDRVFERVGGAEPIEVDVRLIAATNADLSARVRAGRFREDLFYRLNVVAIEMPPLRDRGDDILLLAQSALARHARANGKDISGFTQEAGAKLVAYDWPGNVRELENATERAAVLASSSQITAEMIELEPSDDDVAVVGSTLKEIELGAVRATFDSTGGNTQRTAEILGMAPRTVQYRLKELGLARPRGRPSKTSPPGSKHG
jgi:two-component system response regulator HydG